MRLESAPKFQLGQLEAAAALGKPAIDLAGACERLLQLLQLPVNLRR